MNQVINQKTKFKTLFCEGDIIQQTSVDKYDIIVNGVIMDQIKNNVIYCIAASPADRKASYTGSGFPFHNERQAFQNTPNKLAIQVVNNTFSMPLLFPNSYYVELGNKLIPPTLFIRYHNGEREKMINIKLGDPIPYRLLGYPPKEFTLSRNDASFYHAHHNLPVRSQEQVLRDSSYPDKNKMASDFWGLRPSL